TGTEWDGAENGVSPLACWRCRTGGWREDPAEMSELTLRFRAAKGYVSVRRFVVSALANLFFI
ncbi:MAG: hypothetical protein ACK517_00910, partial [bacterium]